MINESVDWEYSQNNLTSRPYRQPLYQGGAMEDDFGIRYYFNQIRSLNKPNPMLMQNHYQIQMERKIYSYKTPLIHGFFTTKNAKFWYLNFI
jgi:hypothetical protein